MKCLTCGYEIVRAVMSVGPCPGCGMQTEVMPQLSKPHTEHEQAPSYMSKHYTLPFLKAKEVGERVAQQLGYAPEEAVTKEIIAIIYEAYPNG